MDNEHKETLAEISADIRERAENVKRHGDEHHTSGEAIGNLLLSIADRIDRAGKVDGETSDGFHTFNELYHHRAVLFSVIVRCFRDFAWKSKLHADGTMFDGYFIVGVTTPKGEATYHYAIDPYWDMFNCVELERAPQWDGHTPADAIERIGGLEPIGNVSKLREALKETIPWLAATEAEVTKSVRPTLDKVEAALAAPPRNCDVGTADEQARRFFEFCHAHKTPANTCSPKCPFYKKEAICNCITGWGQLPYEAKGGRPCES